MFKQIDSSYYSMLSYYSNDISKLFIDRVMENNTIILGYFHETDRNVKTDPIGFIIYRKTKVKKQSRYFILLISISPMLRGVGYGRMLINEFIHNFIDIQNSIVIVHSTLQRYSFYKSLEFKRTRYNYLYKTIYKYEPYDENDIILVKRFLL